MFLWGYQERNGHLNYANSIVHLPKKTVLFMVGTWPNITPRRELMPWTRRVWKMLPWSLEPVATGWNKWKPASKPSNEDVPVQKLHMSNAKNYILVQLVWWFTQFTRMFKQQLEWRQSTPSYSFGRPLFRLKPGFLLAALPMLPWILKSSCPESARGWPWLCHQFLGFGQKRRTCNKLIQIVHEFSHELS